MSMKIPDNQIVAIPTKADKELSKLQKQFNAYSRKIEKLKTELAATQEVLENAQQKVAGILMPLERQRIDLRVEIVWTLDRQYDSGGYKKREREDLAEFIIATAHQLIDGFGRGELKPLFEKYENRTYEEYNRHANQQTGERMKQMFDMFGIDLDENADLSDMDTFKEAYQRKAEAGQEAYEAHQTERKKSAKQLEREEKLRSEAQNITKTVRAAYMQLVKAFHPDREKDSIEKERKTSIMQRITEAYQNNDLFELLRLQLEYNQKDSGDFERLPDEQLKYYNKLLKEQAGELENELHALQSGDNPFEPGIYQRLCTPPERLDENIAREAKQMKKAVKEMKNEVRLMEDPDMVCELIKQHRQMRRQAAKRPVMGGIMRF